MIYNSTPSFGGTPTGGFPYPSTVINPIQEKPQVSTLTAKEEKLLASSGGNEFVFTEEEMAVAHCNHSPSTNGQNVLQVESDDGTVAKFYCTRCHTRFEVDRRITEQDVSKVCDLMHNILNMIKTYLGSEISPDFARDVFSIQAAFPKLPRLYAQAKKSIENKVAAYNQQFQYANPGAFFGQANPYQTAFANGLTSPAAQYQYSQYAQAAYPMFNGNGMPINQYNQYGGQPMAGAMPAQNPYAPQMANLYTPQAGLAPMPTGGIMPAGSNPFVAEPANGAPAGTGAFTVPAPNGGAGMMFDSVQPTQVTAAPAAPMAGATAPATPQMNIPTVGAAPAVPPIANPTAAPNAAPATPVGSTSTISL